MGLLEDLQKQKSDRLAGKIPPRDMRSEEIQRHNSNPNSEARTDHMKPAQLPGAGTFQQGFRKALGK